MCVSVCVNMLMHVLKLTVSNPPVSASQARTAGVRTNLPCYGLIVHEGTHSHKTKKCLGSTEIIVGLGEEAMLSILFTPYESGTCFWPCHVTGTETGPGRQSHLLKAQLSGYGICIPDCLNPLLTADP